MAKKFRYQHIMSAVEGKLPTAEQLKDAEIAVNVFAGAEKLAIKNSNGDIVTFGTEAQANDAIAAAVEGFVKADDVYSKAEVDEKVAPLAVKTEVTEEINAAATALQDGIDDLEEKKANVEDVPSIEGLAVATAVTEEIAAAVAPLAVKAEVTEEINAASVNLQQGIDELDEKKVDWTESTPGRKHIVLKNHDSILGTATDGMTYNVAMVSKWDVADFGSSNLHLNLNSKDGIATINDDKAIATKDEVEAVDAKVDALVIPSIDGLAVATAVTEEIAAAVAPLATKEEVSEAAAAAVAQVVANAPEDFDTLKEVADYIASDKTKAAEIESKLGEHDSAIESLENGKATKEEVAAVDAKVDAIDLEPYATKDEVEAVDAKADAVDAKVDALVIPSIDGLAVATAVTDEIAAAVAPLAVAADVYTKTEADDKFATKEELALKADSDKVYTQEDVDALLLAKENEIYNLTKIVGDIGGAVTYDLPNAAGKSFNTLMNNNGTVKLADDVTTGRFGPGITAKNTVKLNLNGHDLNVTGLTISSPQCAIMARGTQEITIGGKGTIDAGEGICIEANGASSVINLTGSTSVYRTNRSGGELIYCYAGTINITNGTFRNDGDDKKFMMNCYDANYRNGTAKIVVTGGKFYDFDPGNNTAEGEGTSFLAEGYESVASVVEEDGVEHTVYTVKKSS